jgi:hypothetical protein
MWDMARKKHIGVFVASVWAHWEACFGATFALALALAQYLFLGFGDPHRLPQWVRDFPPSLWLGSGGILLFWACYATWRDERIELIGAEEQLKSAREEIGDRYPRLKGEIKLAYLDVGVHWEKEQIFRYPGSCVLTLYLLVVNHSDQVAIPLLPPVLKLRIGGRDYPGEYVAPTLPNRMRMNDSMLKGDSRIIDLFQFGVTGLGMGAFQKGYPRPGWLVFNLPDSQEHLEGLQTVSGTVSTTIKDTLGREHTIGTLTAEIEFRLNKLGFTPQ